MKRSSTGTGDQRSHVRRWALARALIVALSFLSVTVALSPAPGQAFFYWYLYFSPVIVAALSFGLAGAAAASAWAVGSLAILFGRSVGLATTSVATATEPGLSEGLTRTLSTLLASGAGTLAVDQGVIAWTRFTDLFANALIGMALVSVLSLLVGWLVDDGRRKTAYFEHLARIDGLTGVSNYRDLMERLRQEIDRGQRFGRACAYLMLDVDGLKAYNDTYGHLAGDNVLRRLAELLRSEVRSIDTVGRYGGDEFGIVRAGTGPEGAAQAGQRLRKAVAAAFYGAGPGRGAITVSIGIATFPAHGSTVEALIAAADTALYQSKLAGKDGVTMAVIAS